jgi:hypothetical protein
VTPDARRKVLDPDTLPEAARLALGLGRSGRRARPRELEHAEQVELFRWARENEHRLPALRWLFAVPNGGHRHKATAGKLKAAGVKAGVPDVLLLEPAGRFYGLAIELKRPDGGRVTAEQTRWLAHLSALGFDAYVCDGWERARDVILDYLNAPA